MIKQKPNPLNFLDIRRLEKPPEHFEYITLPIKYNLEMVLSKWITDNLKNRFYIGKTVCVDEENNLKSVLQIGFEEPRELSYFTLACPYLKFT